MAIRNSSPPKAGDHVAGAEVVAQPRRDLGQHRVPRGVAEGVVHGLEAVDVGDHHGEGAGGGAGGFLHALEVGERVAAVVEAGEVVRHREAEAVLHRGAQAVGIGLAAELGADADREFGGLEAHGEDVVRAEVERHGRAVAVALAVEDEDRGVAGGARGF